MDTASQVLVATAIAVALGLVIGVWAAESERVTRLLRPVLDTLQTLPQLVYIIPFIYLMPVSRIPGVVASVLYALPVIIRLVANGVRGVSPPPSRPRRPSARRACRCSAGSRSRSRATRSCSASTRGSSSSSPWSSSAGWSAPGALGDMVARGLQRNDFGAGVVASLAILALGIALDRVTQGDRAARAREERTGRRRLRG